jgi:hypothetical protein
LAHHINATFLNGRGWIEQSRNGRGAYIWIRLLLAAGETAADVRTRLKELNDFLKTFLPHHAKNGGVGFDAVKGNPWHAAANPEYAPGDVAGMPSWYFDADCVDPCPPWLRDPIDIYDWYRRHYIPGRFRRYEELEPITEYRGVLITMPLHGVYHDADGGDARWRSFFGWEGDESKVIPSADLWALIPAKESAKARASAAASDNGEDANGAAAADVTDAPTFKPRRSGGSGRQWAMLASDDKLEPPTARS